MRTLLKSVAIVFIINGYIIADPAFTIEADAQSFKEYLDFARQLVNTPSIDADVSIALNDEGLHVSITGVELDGDEAEVHMGNTRISIPLKNGDCIFQYKEHMIRNQILVHLLIKSKDSKTFNSIRSERIYNSSYEGEPLDLAKTAVFHDKTNQKSRITIPFKESIMVPIKAEKVQ